MAEEAYPINDENEEPATDSYGAPLSELIPKDLPGILDGAVHEALQHDAEPLLKSKKALAFKAPNSSQWSVNGDGLFFPTPSTIPSIPAGAYMVVVPMQGPPGLKAVPIDSDNVYELPESVLKEAVADVESFWANESRYRKYNLLYKRGILLYGPPGAGKTQTIKLLMKKLIAQDGIVILAGPPQATASLLKSVRAVEPTRKLILVFEDIDASIRYNGEQQILAMLDGEMSIDNVLNIATTNYIEALGARISNRPSRFDRRFFVGMPSEAARAEYLRKAASDMAEDTVQSWAKDTEGMSISHLRELIAAVHCLGQPYTEVLPRLKGMAIAPKDIDDGFAKPKSMGFNN